MYEGTPPWEIGRPQGAVGRLVMSGELRGRVLDIGCGTGENALLVASAGNDVLGVDLARPAIEAAQQKALERGISATFLVQDVLSVRALGRRFDSVLDSGFFHTLSDVGRKVYAETLASVMVPGATLF